MEQAHIAKALFIASALSMLFLLYISHLLSAVVHLKVERDPPSEKIPKMGYFFPFQAEKQLPSAMPLTPLPLSGPAQ